MEVQPVLQAYPYHRLTGCIRIDQPPGLQQVRKARQITFYSAQNELAPTSGPDSRGGVGIEGRYPRGSFQDRSGGLVADSSSLDPGIVDNAQPGRIAQIVI